MEPTETTESILPVEPQPDMIITAEAKYFLHTAGRWASFLGVLGFIGTGFVVIIALFIGTIFSYIGRLNPAAAAMPAGVGGIFTFIYLLVAVFYFFMSYYIYQFGVAIKNGTTFNDPILATKAFKNLKSHFKLIGITAIVFISIYLLALVIGIIVAIAAAAMR
jgi:hypothetical protein